MLKFILIISVFILLISCKSEDDPVITSPPPPPQNEDTITPDTPKVCPVKQTCDDQFDFNGIINDSTIIFDESVSLFWDLSLTAISYALFQIVDQQYTLIATIHPGIDHYTIKNLTPETEYEFIVKAITPQGSTSCNEKTIKLKTLIKTEFRSCYDIFINRPNTPSGYYDIKLEDEDTFINVYCDMENNGKGWTKIFYQDYTAGLFTDKTDALEKNLNAPTESLYSILNKIEKFQRDGKYTFWIYYPELDGTARGNIWTQTSNPTKSSVSNYIAIREDHTSQRWGGLEKSTNSSTLIDGSVNHSNWYYAIGTIKSWSGGIPGPASPINQVTLFIK